MQSCTCSSDFLFRVMTRGVMAGAGWWKPLGTRANPAKRALIKSTKLLWLRLPAAAMIMLFGEKRCR